MSMQTGKKTPNGIKFSPRRIISNFGAPLVIAALMCSAPFATTVPATTLLDPKHEDAPTRFGSSIAVLGDNDGDGVPDLAVGAPFQDGDVASPGGFGPPQDVGKVFLISGATLGEIRSLNDPEFQVVSERKFGGQFGTSVANLGDINGDGISDILVGVPHHIVSEGDENEFNAGEALVFSGSDGSILFTLEDPTPQENARMGFAVAGLGDVNGDGVNDMLVGVPKKDTPAGLADVGTAYIFSGADGSLIRSLNPPSQGGSEANGRFGAAVANAGDVNGDGVSDILIGAPGQGRAYVFSSATGALIFTLISPSVDKLPSFGFAVAGGQDLNGDGSPDFAIGAPLQGDLRGAAYIFSGRDGTVLLRLRAAQQRFAKFGSSVALTPDMTGDGRPDILVGAPDRTVNGLLNAGAAFIFSGRNGRLFRTVTAETPKAFAGFGYAVTTADFNNDGTRETVVGAPFQDADLIEHGDVETHLQIGQIEVQ
jgi:hypothetical protein